MLVSSASRLAGGSKLGQQNSNISAYRCGSPGSLTGGKFGSPVTSGGSHFNIGRTPFTKSIGVATSNDSANKRPVFYSPKCKILTILIMIKWMEGVAKSCSKQSSIK